MRFCWLHAYKLSRSDWNTEWLAGQFIILDVLQSLAYNDTRFPGITTSDKSPMKIAKNKGPNEDPWGTPCKIHFFCDNSLFSVGEIILTKIKKRTGDTKITQFFVAGYYVLLCQMPLQSSGKQRPHMNVSSQTHAANLSDKEPRVYSIVHNPLLTFTRNG